MGETRNQIFQNLKLTLRRSNDDRSALGDVWDSSPGQEEGTVDLKGVNAYASTPKKRDSKGNSRWSSWSCQIARWSSR
jgi:hypothetical protein